MSIVLLPSVLAILVKFWLLIKVRRSKTLRLNWTMLGFLLSMLLVNAAEFALILIVIIPSEKYYAIAFFVLKTYYVGMIIGIAFFVLLVSDLTNQLKDWFSLAMLTLAGIIAVMVAFSTLIIADVEYLSYVVTRVAGNYYWVFQIYSAVFMMLSYGWLLLVAVSEHSIGLSIFGRKRCLVLAMAFAPTLLSGVTILILMAVGVQLNATIWLSGATSFFLIALILSSTHSGMLALLEYVPGTSEWRSARLLKQENRFTAAELLEGRKISIKESNQIIEHLRYVQAFDLCGRDYELTAKRLNVCSATVRRKIKPPAGEATA